MEAMLDTSNNCLHVQLAQALKEVRDDQIELTKQNNRTKEERQHKDVGKHDPPFASKN